MTSPPVRALLVIFILLVVEENAGAAEWFSPALGLKAVFLVTTILGITGLWPTIFADTGAAVLVTANAMRLFAWRAPPR